LSGLASLVRARVRRELDYLVVVALGVTPKSRTVFFTSPCASSCSTRHEDRSRTRHIVLHELLDDRPRTVRLATASLAQDATTCFWTIVLISSSSLMSCPERSLCTPRPCSPQSDHLPDESRSPDRRRAASSGPRHLEQFRLPVADDEHDRDLLLLERIASRSSSPRRRRCQVGLPLDLGHLARTNPTTHVDLHVFHLLERRGDAAVELQRADIPNMMPTGSDHRLFAALLERASV